MVELRNQSDIITALKQGSVVALPTETVYGLAIIYDNDNALEKLLSIKGRSFDDTKVFTLIPKDSNQISDFVAVPQQAQPYIEQFPAPLTILLPKNPNFHHPYYDHFSLIGIRLPDHPLFTNLPFPIMLTSANRRGQPPLNTAEEIKTQLPELDAIFVGDSGHQPPSTVISFANPDHPTVLRQGSFKL